MTHRPSRLELLSKLLRGVVDGRMSVEEAVEAAGRRHRLAHVRHGRLRRSISIAAAAAAFRKSSTAKASRSRPSWPSWRRLPPTASRALATRVSPEQAEASCGGSFRRRFTIRSAARFGLPPPREASLVGTVAVVTAGTSDRPVAEEALETLRWMECNVDLIVDIGVAGPKRLLQQKHRFDAADAVVVIAGMEGALPSVVGGWVACPVVAVPTSVGYGANFGGIAALLGMLNSCASNVCVVNIDSGFKGAYIAGLIARRAQAGHTKD